MNNIIEIPLCPICKSYIGWQGHTLHRYGKYRVVYIAYIAFDSRNGDQMKTLIQLKYTGKDDSYGWETKMTLNGFVVLDEERIEKLLLLQ